MPSSYRRYAVDFDGDGRPDLVKSIGDSIGSVANYYRQFSWTTGGEIAAAVQAGKADVASPVAAGIKPHTTGKELRAAGLIGPASVADDTEATVFTVETESATQVWLGFNNFYVITRYNRSINYAMAVMELAQELRNQMR